MSGAAGAVVGGVAGSVATLEVIGAYVREPVDFFAQNFFAQKDILVRPDNSVTGAGLLLFSVMLLTEAAGMIVGIWIHEKAERHTISKG